MPTYHEDEYISDPERKRGSDREIHSPAEADVVRIAMEVDALEHEPRKRKKPLKPYRSQAERTRVRQGYCLIFLGFTNVCLSCLIALHAFGIIV